MTTANSSTPARVRRLIDLVRGEDTDHARSSCDHELRRLGLPFDLTETVLQRVAEKRTVPGMVASLETFADSLERLALLDDMPSNACPAQTPLEPPPSHMPARKVGMANGHFYLLPIKDIVCFSSANLLRGETVVDAVWRKDNVRPSSHIYLQAGKDIWISQYRSLAELERRLGPQKFLSITRSTLINVNRVSAINVRDMPKLLGVEVTHGNVEWFPISRRSLSKVCSFLGLRC